MKVHIVWPTPKGDRILDRLAGTLAERTGWTVDGRPDPGADLNYSICYIDLAQRFTDWQKTMWAAYFSHFENDAPYKVYWWETAAPLTRIQTVTAERYGKMLPNPVKVTPFVEERFEIRERKRNETPLVGVSGFVDRKSKRKGAGLVARLAAELEGAELVASGDGWPARHVNRSFEGLVDFYNSLDVYICTSTVEGIPMPPLEALRCGIPIVIPKDVGMMDELALTPGPSPTSGRGGIWRYEAGNYDELKSAVELAVRTTREEQIDRDALRGAASGYTEEAWAVSHVRGFEKAMGRKVRANGLKKGREKVFTTSMSRDQHGQRGVYYVAYGEPAVKCAVGAIDSFKKYLPEIPVAIVSQSPDREKFPWKDMKADRYKKFVELFEKMVQAADVFIDREDEDIGGRAAKVMIDRLAPVDWTYVCYLDVDTEITAAERFIWEVVEDGWDMVICKNPGRFHMASQMKRSDNGDECEYTYRKLGTDQLMQLNGGVFCYQRNPRTQTFFEIWEREWRRYGKRDQAALLRALFEQPLKLYVLGNEWNTITRYDSPEIAAWLLHYPMTARRWRGVVHFRLDDPQAWEAVKKFEREQK